MSASLILVKVSTIFHFERKSSFCQWNLQHTCQKRFIKIHNILFHLITADWIWITAEAQKKDQCWHYDWLNCYMTQGKSSRISHNKFSCRVSLSAGGYPIFAWADKSAHAGARRVSKLRWSAPRWVLVRICVARSLNESLARWNDRR